MKQYSEMIRIESGDLPKAGRAPYRGTESAYDDSFDELLPAVVEYVLEEGVCYIKMIQHRYDLSYSRATVIVLQLEDLGVVESIAWGPRSVLVDRAGWEKIAQEHGIGLR